MSSIVYVIMGPTGSGKTALVSELDPTRFEVVSCDSRQVYRGMEIGTAAPEPEVLARIPHHLCSFLKPDEEINAGLFVKKAEEAFVDIFSRAKTPVLVGGTGFYYRALRTGLPDVAINQEIRKQVLDMSPEEMWERMQNLDPDSLQPAGLKELVPGKIHANDAYRLGRALEIILDTGKTMAQHRADLNAVAPQGKFQFTGWKLEVEREFYNEQLFRRAEQILEAGFLDETETVLNTYGPDCPGLKTLGYNFALDVLAGRLPKAELAESLAISHRQYGKKQRTWFRREDSLDAIANTETRALAAKINAGKI